MWNREQADKRKETYLVTQGWELVSLDEKDLHQLNLKRTEGKRLGMNPNSPPYHRTENCKRMDALFGKPQKGDTHKDKEEGKKC